MLALMDNVDSEGGSGGPKENRAIQTFKQDNQVPGLDLRTF